MAIDIPSLFADIIDTPAQRQQRMLQQGMAQGQLLASGLRGRAAALAPLAQVAGELGVQRQENLRRAIQPMLGIDPRTPGEKLQEKLANIDTSTPKGLLDAANAIQSIDPIRAAALRQEAARLRTEEEDRALARQTEEMRQLELGTRIAADTQRMRLAANAEQRAQVAAESAARMAGLSEAATALEISKNARDMIASMTADANRDTIAQSIRDLGSEYELYAVGVESGSFDAIDALPRIAAQMQQQIKNLAPEDFKVLSTQEEDHYYGLAQDFPVLKNALSKGFFGIGAGDLSKERFYSMVAAQRSLHPSATDMQNLQAVASMISNGTGAAISEFSEAEIEAMAQQRAGVTELTQEQMDESAATAAASLRQTSQPVENQSVDPEFEIVLQNLRNTGSSTDQAVQSYLNRTRQTIQNIETAIRNRQSTNRPGQRRYMGSRDTSDLEARLAVLKSRLNRYSQ